MAKQLINIGERPNDRTGDKIRTSWSKANGNFDELYDLVVPPTMQPYVPHLRFADSSAGITYEHQKGGYLRYGDLVVVRALLILKTRGSASGQANVTLPFTGVTDGGAVLSGYINKSYAPAQAQYLIVGATKLAFLQFFKDGSMEAINETHFRDDTILNYGGAYLAVSGGG